MLEASGNPFYSPDRAGRAVDMHYRTPSVPRGLEQDTPGHARIKHLPTHSSRLIAATLRIPSVAAVLEALLWNSLQGGARKVDVWLELEGEAAGGAGMDLTLKVQDDGAGIGRGVLDEVGEWLGTVEEDDERVSSIRGDTAGEEGPSQMAGHVACRSLAAVSQLSLLEITTTTSSPSGFIDAPSHTRLLRSTASARFLPSHALPRAPVGPGSSGAHAAQKIIKGGKTLYCGPAKRGARQGKGTRVVVKDLFHNVPVRQRTLLSSAQAAITQCKRVIESITLIHPGVEWNLYERRSGSVLGTNNLSKQLVRVTGKCAKSIDVFRELYGRAGVEHVQSIRVSSGKRRMDGFISLEGSVSRSHQHFYINSRPIPPGDLHALISKKFANSKFSKYAAGGLDDAVPPSARKSPRRLERYPIYVLNMTTPNDARSLNARPISFPSPTAPVGLQTNMAMAMPAELHIGRDECERTKRFVVAVVDEFLGRHGFISSVTPALPGGGIPAPARPGSAPVTTGGEGGMTLAPGQPAQSQSTVPASNITHLTRSRDPSLASQSSGEDANAPTTPIRHLRSDARRTEKGAAGSPLVDDLRRPLTTDVFETPRADTPPALVCGSSNSTRPAKRRKLDMVTPVREASTTGKQVDVFDGSFSVDASGRKRFRWIDDIVGSVDAGLLPFVLRQSARAHLNIEDTSHEQNDHHEEHECCASAPPITRGHKARESHEASTTKQPDRYFDALPSLSLPDTSTTTRSQMRPTDVSFFPHSIASASVIKQVDTKFIACVMSGTLPRLRGDIRPGTQWQPLEEEVKVLVLVDQHAADERVSVEPIFDELCSGFLRNAVETQLIADLAVVLTREEGNMLRSEGALGVLQRWGIHLDVPLIEDDEPGEYVQVAVKAVPAVLKSRLGRKEGKEMLRLLKVYLPFLAEHIGQIHALLRRYDEEGEGGAQWTEVLRWMPLEMVELVNSKACRNAIMFGDPLELDQCERLVAQLGQTRHPFICAHGRPTTVPLLVLPSRDEVTTSRHHIEWTGWKAGDQ